MRLTTSRPAARGAFTLVELLVVISIIAIILALTGAAIFKTAEVQKVKATKVVVTRTQQALEAEYSQIVQRAATSRRDHAIPQEIVNYCDRDEDRAQAMWTALLLRQHFPETFAEARTGIQVTDTATPPNVLARLQPLETFRRVWNLNGTGRANEESGALLYIILADKSVSGGGAMASSADELGPQHAVTFPGRPGMASMELKTFADPYGNSIGFHRWQTSGVQTAEYGTTDPLDPKNLVNGWADTTKRNAVRGLLQFGSGNRMVNVYSPGKDKNVGTADDINGYELRRHGK